MNRPHQVTGMVVLGIVSLCAMVTMPAGADAEGGLTSREHDLELASRQAISEDPVKADVAIAALRAEGPVGLEAFLRVHAEALNSHQPDLRFNTTLNAICQQYDCYASKLYWYTDLEQAKAAARATAKPILSLRLLGNLNEEFSCANSRFFRTALYANSAVSTVLRKNFVLHWKSVRPVPRLTVDFGDGRRLERTITGNSIHYVLDPEGRPIDALPGLYAPEAFLAVLTQAGEAAASSVRIVNDQDRETFLKEYHRQQLSEIALAWAGDLARIDTVSRSESRPAESPTQTPQPSKTISNLRRSWDDFTRTLKSRLNRTVIPAAEAGQVAVSKTSSESPFTRSAFPAAPAQPDFVTLQSRSEAAAWDTLASLHVSEARLDANSRSLILAQNPREKNMDRVIEAFERSMALDTVRNEYLLHRQIHEWLSDGAGSDGAEALNGRVYAELFLTPNSDPWLGLVVPGAYSGLKDDGIRISVEEAVEVK